MDVIRDAAGVSKATLYNYFPSKLELFVEVIQREAAASVGQEFASLAAGVHDLSATLRQHARSVLTGLYSPEMLAIRRMVAFESGRSDLGRVCYERGPSKGEAMTRELLQQAMDEGALRQADPAVAAHHLRALIESEFVDILLFDLPISVVPERIAAAADRAIDVFMAAYGAGGKDRAVSA